MISLNNNDLFQGKYNFYIPPNITMTTENVFFVPLPPPLPTIKKVPVEALKTNGKPILSSLTLSGNGVIGDFASHIRQLSFTSNKVYNTPHPKALAALGFTSAFSVISGGLNVKNGLQEVVASHKISDTAGKALGALKAARGGAFAAGGVVLVPARALTIAEVIKNSTTLAHWGNALGTLGGSLFTLGSLFAGISTGFRLHEQRLFRDQLFKILNDPALSEELRPIKALEYLKTLATVTEQEKTQILKELEIDPKYCELTPEDKLAMVSEKEKQLLGRKEAHLKRITDSDCFDLICKKDSSESLSVIEAVKKSSLKHVILSSIAMGLICTGLALFIASFIFTGPFALMIAAAIGLATSIGWLLLDGYDLINDFAKSTPGRFDKLWICLSSAVAVISVGLVILLTSGIAPLVAACSVGVVWLGINIACYYRLYHLKDAVKPAVV